MAQIFASSTTLRKACRACRGSPPSNKLLPAISKAAPARASTAALPMATPPSTPIAQVFGSIALAASDLLDRLRQEGLSAEAWVDPHDEQELQVLLDPSQRFQRR